MVIRNFVIPAALQNLKKLIAATVFLY